MGAVWMRVRAEMRARWRAWLGLSLLLGVFGGAVLAAAAGARRTDSVVARADRAEQTPDVFMATAFIGQEPVVRSEDVAAIPEVEAAVPLTLLGTPDERLEVSVAPAGAFPRPKILEGRDVDPAAADEAIVNYKARDRFGVRVGDRLPVQLIPAGALVSEGLSGETSEAPPLTVSLRVVGIGALVTDHALIAKPGVGATPAFLAAHAGEIATGEVLMVTLRRGAADLPAFREHVQGLSQGEEPLFFVEARDGLAQVQRAFGVQAVALWLLAAFLAAPVLLIFAQSLARQTAVESTDHPTLRALGLSAGNLFAVGMLRASAIAAAGGAIALGVGAVLSPVFPLGLPRLSEPDPGFAFDSVALGGGAAALLAICTLLGAAPARRAARAPAGASGAAEVATRSRPSVLAGFLARVLPRPAPAIGARFATEPGHGRTAVPVRTTIAATTAGLVAVAMAITIGGSLDRLLTTPRLYGWSWDVVVGWEFGSDPGPHVASLRDNPDVEAFAVGFGGAPLEIEGRKVDGIALSPAEGTVEPVVVRGRAPAGAGEIFLGLRTLRQLGLRVGESVEVRVSGFGEPARLRVVGTGVPPAGGRFQSDTSALGEGAILHFDGIARLAPGFPPAEGFVRFSRGAERGAALDRLRREFGDDNVRGPSAPADLVNFGRVSSMPVVLGGILATLAAATIAHGIVASTRRRRRDLAILKTIGFDRRGIRTAVTWHASTVGAFGLLLGVPLGVAAARWTWLAFADRAGFLAEPVAEPLVLGLLVPVTLAFATLVAALPARAAARTRPALVLRAE